MIELFSSRKTQFQIATEKLKSYSSGISIARIILFLILISGLLILLNKGLMAYFSILLILSFILFGLVVKYHRKIKDKVILNENLAQINEDEIKRLQLKLEGFDTGEQYLNEHHSYAFDLDIFGRHSLFQLVSRCTTKFGFDLLAKDLQQPQSKENIYKRHEAILELKDQIDWRQKIQAIGKGHIKGNEHDLKAFLNWLSNSQKIKNLKLLSIFSIFIWFAFSITTYFIVIGQINFYWIFLFNIIALVTLGPKIKLIQEITVALSKAKQQLLAVKDIIIELDSNSFKSSYLHSLLKGLEAKNISAYDAIKQLSEIVELLNNRGNNLYLMANYFLLFDFVLLQKAEKWKNRYATHVEDWLLTIGHFEVILSYSAFAYAHPDFAFPTVAEVEFEISGKEIGHPLIDPDSRVNNEYEMVGKGAVTLITGSNMAGKSTFLRSLGINMVLAQTGAPVCASTFSFSSAKVFTSMRTKDNLEESISTFYAELLRIKALIKSMDEKMPTFYLLDEILKGTNSHDRHLGAQALMRQLNKSNAFGLVSTHDVELHELSFKMEKFHNFSFHSQLVNGNLQFNYKLQKGPCLNFNAIELMKKMGITIE